MGTGNLNTDPRFVDAGGGDFRLQQCSPAIDAVTNTNAPTADFEGNARPFNATGVNNADMGAYEYRSAYDVCSVCATSTELTISTLIHNRTGTVGYWRGCGIYGLYKVRITAKGAKGGNNGGAGAVMIGEFIVSPGQVLESVAGASGGDGNRGGGGGGSGTRIQGGLPLIIAGGGGGNSGGGFGLITKGNGQGGNWLVTGGGGGGGLNGSGFGGVMGGGAGFNALGGSASGNGGGGYGGGGGGTGLHAGGGGGQTGGTAITPSSGGASYNLGSNQNNTEGANNAGGQVIIEYLGTASLSATATASQPTCATPNQGSVSIDLTGDLTGNTSGGVEYAIVSGGSFSGNPTFADVTADPLNLTAGTGTTLGTYTVRIRLKYNPDLYIDRTYTISPKLTGTIYVKANATGANNGTTWTDAFTSLQDALSAVCSGAQIWVAAGTYKPTADASGNMAPTDARTRTFVMKDGVAIYGGFNGTETQLSQRNWVANETILSGDIDGTPDVVTGSGSTLSITGNDGNSYHVIYNDNNGLSNSAILDGFTVSGGNASAISGLNNNGGGMYNNNASPTVVNCKFIYNNASNSGGGAYFNSSNITIDNCSFNLNSSGLGGGFNISSSSIAVNHCQYTGNRAKTGSGGGINVTSTASLTMSSCQVTENSAISFGGGINSFGVLTILSSQINNNTAANGGGVAQANRELIMNNCEIRNNRTIFQSAGINLQDVSSAILTNCVISGNESQSSQGGISLMTYNATNSQATLINCTVANNKSVNGFGAIWTYVDQSGKTATFTLKNTIVANNPGGNFLRGNQPTNPVYFGTIQSQGNNLDSDGSSGFSNGINGDLVNVDPLFVSSTDSRLQACSPAINAGDPATTSALVGNLDLDTNPRFFNNGTVDMGAYEYQGTFDAVAPAAQVTNSVCTTFGSTPSGGVISAPSGSCPAGSSLYYSTNNGDNWSTTLPIYVQEGPAQTILTRCTCDANPSTFGPTSTVTTVPGTCPACPDLTSAAPAVQVTNSVCTTFGGTASGGVISAPSSSCPAGSTLQYSTDNGGNWSITLPTYEQTGSGQTILTRCNCTADASKSSPTSTMTTVPGTCPACPDLTAAAPVVQVTNSVCTTFGGTASGGSISAPSSSCPSGSTLYYSTDNGGNWSKILPTYVQEGPSQTILTRCTCDANANTSSPTSTVTTVPGVCPACPVLTSAAPAVQVTNSVCQTGCVIGGGSIAVPSTSCSVGSTLQYQLNGGDWSTTLPTYVQTGPAQTIKTRCVCNSNASQTSPESSVTTVPGTVPMLVVPSNGLAVVSCPALATLPVPPVVNDCSGAAITPSSPTITNSPDPLTCEGTRTYTYTYQCGTRTASWSFVYTIEREGFTVNTPNGSATVYDASLAVAPTPPTVLSQCGETLTPSAPVITNSPNPLVCEGTRTYTYTFTDCEGNTVSWSYVYTILDNIAPSITCPANITACEGQTITFAPPVGTDNCLGAVTTQIAGLPTSSLYPVGITTNTYKVTATNGQSSTCSFTVTVQGKPTITLSTLQQTLVEGNNPVLCDTDANPVNSLQFNVSGLCVAGNPVWRVQVGSGAWSAWTTNPPVNQLSNNQPHRYQAACDASCTSTYSGVIELTINNRATVPQNVSLLVDGVTVLVGESKEVCSLVTIPLTFNANCAAGEVTLYSVDGGEYSSGVPTGLVDNQYHNYRVRCRKSDGTPSCVESESGVMRLKLVTIPTAPTVSLSSTSSCDATASFSGQSSCGTLRTVWYNATTNVALPNLPSTVPSQTTSYYARCQTENGCVSEKSNVVTFTLTSTQVAPAIMASQEIVCTGTSVTISANCPAGSQTFWNTGVTTPSFEVSFNNVTKQTYWAKCIFAGGCQSAESTRKDIYWNAFVVTLINVGESKSSVKVNDRAAWSSQFITRDGGPELAQSTQQNPTLYYVENANKTAPRYWTINVEACGLSTDGSLTFDMLATPEMGVIRSFNTHENNAPYFMYANREGWTELYAQNHPAYGFYQDNGAGGNAYDAGLPKGLYKLGVRYWDQKGWGSIYPSTRKPQGNVLAYQEYWFRIQSKNGVGVGAAREAISDLSSRRFADARDLKPADNGSFATILPNPVTNTLRLQLQNSKEQVVQTTLTDASGREVLNRQFVPETNSHQEEFEVGELPTGMYFLRVTTPDRQTTLKVVKLE